MDNIRWLYVWKLNSVRAHKVPLTPIQIEHRESEFWSDVTNSVSPTHINWLFRLQEECPHWWNMTPNIPLKCSWILIWIWYEIFFFLRLMDGNYFCWKGYNKSNWLVGSSNFEFARKKNYISIIGCIVFKFYIKIKKN